MPLFPPPQPVEHPADLVIDTFGTFLGKRSERMVVRWRESAGGTRRTTSSGELEESSIQRVESSGEPGGETVKGVSLGLFHDAAARTQNQPGDRFSHPADRAAAELITLWGATGGDAEQPPARPSATSRLADQLDRIADRPAAGFSANEWKEQAVPLSRLRSVTISGRGVTVSSDLIAALVERGIGLSFLSGRGQPVAHLSAPGLGGTVQTRRSQLAASTSPLGVQFAVEFIRGKLRNQKNQLQYSGKYLKGTDPERFERLKKKIASIANLRKQLIGFEADDLDRVRDKLMGYEGTGARLYWEGVAIVLEGRVEFPGRQTRGAIDPVNSALNYGYGILYSKVSSAVVNAGLEMYAGFLHVDRPGKPALVSTLR